MIPKKYTSWLKWILCAQLLQSHMTLCNPMDCRSPGSSVHGILQARILEWVAMPSSRRSSLPRDRTRVSSISCLSRQILYHCTTWEDHTYLCIHIHRLFSFFSIISNYKRFNMVPCVYNQSLLLFCFIYTVFLHFGSPQFEPPSKSPPRRFSPLRRAQHRCAHSVSFSLVSSCNIICTSHRRMTTLWPMAHSLGEKPECSSLCPEHSFVLLCLSQTSSLKRSPANCVVVNENQ